MREPQRADRRIDMIVEPQKQRNRPQFGVLLQQPLEPMFSQHNSDDDFHLRRKSNVSQASGSPSRSGDSSPTMSSPWNQTSPSPFSSSPWIAPSPMNVVVEGGDALSSNGLIGTIVREEGHVYSLAAAGDLLYTGSDSKNIRVWKNMREFSGFKSNSGFVKAIIIAGDRIYTGHQDGKIRVWSVSTRNQAVHKRVGSLPSKKDFVRGSMNPKNYVEGRKNHNVLKIRHFDAVSCMSLNEEVGLLYSGSWDKTMKVWRIANSKCLESVEAHEDAINSVVAGFDGLVFTGSADGTVKVWKRELHGKKTQHFMVQILLKQDNAVTGLAVNIESAVLYCGSSDGNVNFWEREKQLNHGGVLRGHKLAVLCVAAAGNLVFSGSADKTVCVWRREGVGEHTRLNVLSGHMGPVKCLAVEPDRDVLSKKEEQRWILYSGSLDKTLKVWRVLGNAPANHDYSRQPYTYDLI